MTTETQKKNIRFKDENYTLSNFQNEIFVECPKCSKRSSLKKKPIFLLFEEYYLVQTAITHKKEENNQFKHFIN